jgi:hypothetical protein
MESGFDPRIESDSIPTRFDFRIESYTTRVRFDSLNKFDSIPKKHFPNSRFDSGIEPTAPTRWRRALPFAPRSTRQRRSAARSAARSQFWWGSRSGDNVRLDSWSDWEALSSSRQVRLWFEGRLELFRWAVLEGDWTRRDSIGPVSALHGSRHRPYPDHHSLAECWRAGNRNSGPSSHVTFICCPSWNGAARPALATWCPAPDIASFLFAEYVLNLFPVNAVLNHRNQVTQSQWKASLNILNLNFQDASRYCRTTMCVQSLIKQEYNRKIKHE